VEVKKLYSSYECSFSSCAC